MQIRCRELNGLSGHDAGRALLAEMYRARTWDEMPPIAVTDRGKPYFTAGKLHFSISHTKRRVFCVLSDRPVGIDAEEMDRELDLRLADKILSPAERKHYDAAEDKRACLLRLWVLKEARAKVSGRGWGNYLQSTSFAPNDPRVQEIDGCYVAVIEWKTGKDTFKLDI